MRSAIVSIAVMVSSMCSSFRAGIPENVEPHHSPLCFGLTLGEILIKPVDILVKRWQPLLRRDEKPECQIPDLTRRPTRFSIDPGLKRVKLSSLSKRIGRGRRTQWLSPTETREPTFMKSPREFIES